MLNRICILLFFASVTIGCSQMDVQQMIERYMWKKRVVFIFSPQQDHPEFIQMRKDFFRASESLKEREVVVWQLVAETSINIDNERKPQLPTRPFYRYFNVDEDAFAVIVIGKDGNEKYRSNLPLTVPELEKLIDAMPMRKREKKQK